MSVAAAYARYRRSLREAEAARRELAEEIGRAVAAGARPAELAREIGVSRQRLHQLAQRPPDAHATGADNDRPTVDTDRPKAGP